MKKIILIMLIAVSFVYAEVKQDFYRDGTLKSETSFNAKGKKDGIFKKYHRNGKLKQEFLYKNGKMTGIGKIFSKDGNLDSKVLINSDGSMTQKSFYWSPDNGILRETTEMNAKGQTLLLTKFYINGKVKSITIKKNHKAHGVAKRFYTTGTIKTEVMYKNGKLDGLAKRFYSNGNLKKEGIFKPDGTFVGKIYFDNGTTLLGPTKTFSESHPLD